MSKKFSELLIKETIKKNKKHVIEKQVKTFAIKKPEYKFVGWQSTKEERQQKRSWTD